MNGLAVWDELVRDIDDSVPWCPNCEAYAVPNESGECGECGHHVTYRTGL